MKDDGHGECYTDKESQAIDRPRYTEGWIEGGTHDGQRRRTAEEEEDGGTDDG